MIEIRKRKFIIGKEKRDRRRGRGRGRNEGEKERYGKGREGRENDLHTALKSHM